MFDLLLFRKKSETIMQILDETNDRQLVLEGFEKSLVVQSNDLIKACYNLNLIEKKMLLGAIAKVNPYEKLSSTKPVIFSTDEAAKALGLKPNSGTFRHYQKACRGLMSKQFTVLDKENKVVGEWVFCQGAKFHLEDKKIEIFFSEGIIPYLSQLKNNFTRYRLLHIGKFSSETAIRIYEMFAEVMFLREKGVLENSDTIYLHEITLEDFRKILLLENKYRSFNALKVYVIEPALKQINNSTDIAAEVKYKKRGRSYFSMAFTLYRKKEWVSIEQQIKSDKKYTNKQIDMILLNPEFFRDFMFSDLIVYKDIKEFQDKFRKLIEENPSKLGDLSKYLKLKN